MVDFNTTINVNVKEVVSLDKKDKKDCQTG